jgi:hypothetical protein
MSWIFLKNFLKLRVDNMTIYESITAYLNDILLELRNKFIHPFTIIDVENIPLPSDYPGFEFRAGGIFSSPNDITTELMGGQVKHTEFKSFYLRRAFNEFASRIENERFFERFRETIHEKNLDCDFPKDGRSWKEISINAGIYPPQRDTASQWTDYLITFKLVYIE